MSRQIPFKRYVLIGLSFLLMQIPLANAALIGLQPGSSSVTSGGSISLDLVVSGLGDFSAESLGAFDISVGFDASVLSFTSYRLEDYLGDIDLFEAIDASAGAIGGTVNIAEVSLLSAVSLDAMQPADFILATLNFDAADLATSIVTQLAVLPGSGLVDALGAPIAITGLTPARVEIVTAVPVPGTLFLLGVPLVCWRLLRRAQSA